MYEKEIYKSESENSLEFNVNLSTLCPLNCSHLIHFDYIPLNSIFFVTSDSLLTDKATKILLDTYHQNHNQINFKKIETNLSTKSNASSTTDLDSNDLPHKIFEVDDTININTDDDTTIEAPLNIIDTALLGVADTEITPESLTVKIYPTTAITSTDHIKELKDRADTHLKDINNITTPTLNFLKLEEIDKVSNIFYMECLYVFVE